MDKIKTRRASDSPLVSIITVVYNGDLFIEETIKCVIAQTFTNYEFIIIDGNSKDNTLAIVNQYSEHVDLLISEKDNGIYDAMNKGAGVAKGKYLFYLNAGDLLYANTLEDVFCSQDNIDQYDVIYGDIINSSNKKFIKASRPDLIINRMIFCHQAVLVKRELQCQQNFNIKFKIAADYNLFLKLYKQKNSFLQTDICFGEFDDTGISNTRFFRAMSEYVSIIWRSSEGLSSIKEVVRYVYSKKKFIAYLTVLKLIGRDRYDRIKSAISK